jgi:hypothetical protein
VAFNSALRAIRPAGRQLSANTLGVTVHNHPDRQVRNASWNIHAILSFGLGVFTGVYFCFGMLAISADDSFRLAAVTFPLLAVPICFVWSLFAFVTGKDRRGRRLSLLTLLVSGPFVIVGIVFLGIAMIFQLGAAFES